MNLDLAIKPTRPADFYIRRLDRVLHAMGSLYLAQDLVTAMQEGRMQAFVEGESIAFTQIDQYPRAKVLHIVAAVGDMPEMEKIHDKVIEFATQNHCGVIVAFGRHGWLPRALKRGWRVKSKQLIYMLEM